MKWNFSINKHTFAILLLSLFLSSNAKAATVTCDFISGEAYYISTGERVGSDMGEEGRLSNIEDRLIIIYSGFCTIGFG